MSFGEASLGGPSWTLLQVPLLQVWMLLQDLPSWLKRCVANLANGEVREQSLDASALLTKDLLELAEWLHGQGVTHVAMGSFGVYWKPICDLLELNMRSRSC